MRTLAFLAITIMLSACQPTPIRYPSRESEYERLMRECPEQYKRACQEQYESVFSRGGG